MKFKIKENHAGVMTLKDGSKHNYGVIRVTKGMTKMIYYTGKGLREIFKPNMNSNEKEKAEQLRKLSEKELIGHGLVSEVMLADIVEMN